MRGKMALMSAALLQAFACGALAQSWPQRAVNLVVPFTVGTTSDIVGRSLADHLQSSLGQPFVVENRGGAGGNIGGAAVAKATPDGYTLLLATTGPAANNKLIYKNMPYDPQKDLEPIALIGKSPVVIAVRASLPVKTLSEFIAHTKANPGKVSAAYPGIGTLGHITGELVQQRAGISFAQVQHRGSAAIITDLVGGHVDAAMDSMAPYVPLAKEGKLTAIAVGGSARWPNLPDTPTIAEQGFPGLEAAVWYALLAPRGTPADVVSKLNQASNAYLKTAGAKTLFDNSGIQASGGSPKELEAFIAAEIDKWAPIIKAANIQF
jgi:tripartite-type tricarboxylate transporter receptor subunit TctC